MAPSVVQAPPTRSGNGGEKEQPKTALAPRPEVAMTANGFAPRNFDEAWRFADALSKTALVPARYQNKQADCFIALDLSAHWKVHYLTIMGHVYRVHDEIGLDAQLVLTCVNQSGLFVDPLDYEVVGEDPNDKDYRVRAFAVRKSTGKTVYGPWITWKLISGEGWDKKPGSKWLTMTEQMFRYRSASWFSKSICPEVTLGLKTTDELEDIGERKQVESRTLEPTNGRQPFGFTPTPEPPAEAPAAPTAEEKPPEGSADPTGTGEGEPGTDSSRTKNATTQTVMGQPPTTSPTTDKPGTKAKGRLMYRCKNPNCPSQGEPFGRPVQPTSGPQAGKSLCRECNGEDIEQVMVHKGGKIVPVAVETTGEADFSPPKPEEFEKATAPKQNAAPPAKPTVQCLSCKREYVERPKACECGSMLGFKDLK